MNKLFIISTNSKSINLFLSEHIKIIIERYECIIITKIVEDINLIHKNIIVKNLNISRKINLLNDIKSFFYIFYLTLKFRPKLILSITPKAGILSSFVSTVSLSFNHIHFFTGQYWANYKNLKKILFKTLDEFILIFSKKCLVDGRGQLDYLKQNFLFCKNKLLILGDGSIKGIDLKRFRPNNKFNRYLRSIHNIPADKKIILYAGRFNNEKGIETLAHAVLRLIKKGQNIVLMMIGSREDHSIDKVKEIFINYNKYLFILNHINEIERYYNLSYLTCLPSNREGFGMSLLESSACGTPVVGSNIYGLQDSIINNYNGFHFNKGDYFHLSIKINDLICDKNKYLKFKANGIKLVKNKFNEHRVINNFKNFISKY